MNEKPIVKYDNKFYVLEKTTASGMAFLMRDGKATIAPVDKVEPVKDIRA